MFFDLLAAFVKSAGALTEGNAAATSARYNAQIDNFNQTVTLQEGQIAENQVRRNAAQVIGQAEANAGASGFSSTSGSPVDVFQQSAYNAEIDALNTRYTYAMKARGYGMDAQLQRQRAAAAQEGGLLNASSYLLTGFGKSSQDSYADSSRGAVPFRLG